MTFMCSAKPCHSGFFALRSCFNRARQQRCCQCNGDSLRNHIPHQKNPILFKIKANKKTFAMLKLAYFVAFFNVDSFLWSVAIDKSGNF